TRLYVGRARLPAVADPDEFYQADLIGLEAEEPSGRGIGRVVAVHDHGAGAFLEIVPPGPGGESLLIPFARASVPVVDLARRRLVVVPPAELVVPPAAEPRRGAAA
ncbi:MAG: PRC-barrel domain-containing protein, partial [Acetobacteraceae bacterium]